jgi:beta-galactosidase
VKAEGATVARGAFPALDIPAGEEREYTLALPKLEAKPGVEYWLNVSFAATGTVRGVPAGHEVAWDQFHLAGEPAAPAPPQHRKALRVTDAGGTVAVEGEGFALRLERTAGLITDYRAGGVKLIERGPRPDFWRAPTDNDTGAWKAVRGMAARNPQMNVRVWRDAGPDWQVDDVKVNKIDDHTVSIAVSAALPAVEARQTVTYTVHSTGEVDVESAYLPGAKKTAMMPRYGTELVLAPGLERMRLYGRGPVETYSDRAFERIGVYAGTVAEQWVEYSKPQENGNKADVRWLELTNAAGYGLRVTASSPFGAAARHYSKEEVERAGYTFQMRARPEVYLNVDGRQMGVGGIDSWSMNAWPMAPYRIDSAQSQTFRYRLSPVVPRVK